MNFLMRYILLVMLFFTMSANGNYRFTHLTIKEGLSQSTVKAIHQDSKGFIWLGTADGLNKFDGYNFTIYRNDPYSSSSIGGNDISSIYEDPADSTLWIGTQSSGLSLYNYHDDSFHRFTASNRYSLPSNNINAIANSNDGRLWFASKGGGVFWFNKSDSTFVQPAFSVQPEMMNVSAIAADAKEILWIGSETGLYKYDYSSESSPEMINLEHKLPVRILSLLVDRKGFLWIGTHNSGLFRYQPDTKKLVQYSYREDVDWGLKSNTIRCLLERKDGSIWAGTENGLYVFDYMSAYFNKIPNNPSDPESLNDNFLFSLFEDNAGTFWAGSYFGGVNKLYPDESRFTKYSNFHKIFNLNKSVNHITGIFKDRNETVWAATLSGLIELESKYFKNKDSSSAAHIHFSGASQKSVFGDSYHNLYVANDDGIFIRKNKSNNFSQFEPDNLELTSLLRHVTNGFEDSDRNVWMLSAAGLIQYDPVSNTAVIRNPGNQTGGTNPKFFISGIEASNGKLWLGTIDGELYRYDRYIYQFEKILPQNDTNVVQPFNRIFSICEQNSGVIWFGTNNGLYRYNEKEDDLIRFMDSDGLSNNVIYGVHHDNKGQIWCSTNKGISVFQNETGAFVNYTWEDGLQSNEFNQNAFFYSEEGLILYGGIDGFNIIDPLRIKPNQFISPVYITGLTVNHEKITIGSHPEIISQQIIELENVTLKPEHSSFSFEFTALNYIHSQKNRYRYKLIGYDQEWIDNGNERTAGYTNLNPGQYTFMVQGANNSGVWNPVPAKMHINVLPPFWKTAWFKVLASVVILTLIYVVFTLRMSSMRLQASRLKMLVDEKTAALQLTNKQIELQNNELLLINEEMKQRNLKIEEKNLQLNKQNEKIVQQRDKLLHLGEQLESATTAKINFFTHISHEFKTPLTLILGPLIELLNNASTLGRDEIHRKLKIIHSNATRLLFLVNQLLDFRKIETGNMNIRMEKNNIIGVIGKVSGSFNELAERKQINYNVVTSLDELHVTFDPDKLEIIIYNLLSNAFKFTPENGKVELQFEELSREDDSSVVQISVSDTGPGIPNESIPNIFESFYSNDYFPGRPAGSGIGLSLVKEYVRLHNGEVTVQSVEGEGTVFKVVLPLKINCPDNLVENTSPQKQEYKYELDYVNGFDEYIPSNKIELNTGEGLTFPVVLLVEDDAGISSYLNEILSIRFRIIEAVTAKEGFEKAMNDSPDLIICDVMLPDQDGYDLCARLKEESSSCHIPIIMLTALSGQEHEMMGIRSGADAYITKPFDMQHLLMTVNNLITQRRRIYEKFNEGSLHLKINTNNQEDHLFLQRVIAEIELNMADSSFDVEKLCRSVGLSQPQTYRKVKTLTDLSISEFIRNVRLKRAAQLLSSGSRTVSEVAYDVGFNDPNYFSKCFARVFKQTPSAYIKTKI